MSGARGGEGEGGLGVWLREEEASKRDDEFKSQQREGMMRNGTWLLCSDCGADAQSGALVLSRGPRKDGVDERSPREGTAIGAEG